VYRGRETKARDEWTQKESPNRNMSWKIILTAMELSAPSTPSENAGIVDPV
jgi:hypothetical protein